MLVKRLKVGMVGLFCESYSLLLSPEFCGILLDEAVRITRLPDL